MTHKEFIEKLHNEISQLEIHLQELKDDDYVEKGITVGRINGILTACLLSYDITELK